MPDCGERKLRTSKGGYMTAYSDIKPKKANLIRKEVRRLQAKCSIILPATIGTGQDQPWFF